MNNETLEYNLAYVYIHRTVGDHYYIYKDTTNPLFGEMLQCDRDPHNTMDRYSITVKKGASSDFHREKYQDYGCRGWGVQ